MSDKTFRFIKVIFCILWSTILLNSPGSESFVLPIAVSATTTASTSTRTTTALTMCIDDSSNNPKPAHNAIRNVPYIDRMGRKLPTVSTGSAIATAAFVPVWAVTILPFTVLYQVGKAALKPLVSMTTTTKKNQDHLPPLDTGYKVDPAQIIPRADRKYDVVVLGATGFTGGLAVRYLAEQYGTDSKVKWAIAGRSQAKLDQLLQQLADELNMPELVDKIDTLLVDVTLASTLPKLVGQTRVVATTAGPYTFYGNSVVEFCAKFGTHYVDITGEVDWVKSMVCQWQDTAAASGSKLISFCGHDSIPWDLSTWKLQEILKQNANDDLEKVTFWDDIKAEAPGGTLATAMASIEGKSIQAPKMDFDPFLRLSDGTKSKFVAKADLPWSVAKSESPWDTASNTGSQRYTMPFVMAGVNSQIVRWSHALRQEPSTKLTYREMAVCPDWKTAWVSYTSLIIFGSLLMNPVTASLMKRHVLPKPGEGPSMNKMLHSNFLCVSGVGVGTAGTVAESVMYFPKDPGCMETARMLIESALSLALQEDELPVSSSGGGFWTPSTGMGQVLLDRLVATGTHFEAQVVNAKPVRSKL